MHVRTIDPKHLAEQCRHDTTLEVIDVRTPVEFREVHCSYARNVPLHELDPQAFLQQRREPPERPLYVICKSGSRGQTACEKFIAAGFTNVLNVEGGTAAWVAEGLPVVRGKKAVSLERQVRIAAGFLVLLGALTGYFLTPYAIGLAAFVGAGLVFAGLTDTCAMGTILARMPWNQAGTTCNTPTK